MSVDEIAGALDLSRVQCAKLLQVMVQSDFLAFDICEHTYLPTERVRGLGGWMRPPNEFEDFVTGCARYLHREFGLATAVSHRAGLYVDWDFTIGVAKVERGTRLPALRTVNGIVSLAQSDSTVTLGLIGAHNDLFGRDQSVRAYEVIDQIDSVRGRDYGAYPSPLFPGDRTVCFTVQNENRTQEFLLSVVVTAEDQSDWEPIVVRSTRKMLANERVASSVARHPLYL